MKSAINLVFPTAGVVRRHSFQQQVPYTCYEALNVVPDDPFLERERGGSRPGTEIIEGGGIEGPVRWIGSVGYRDTDGDLQRRTCAIGGGSFYFYDDGFVSQGSGLTTETASAIELNSKVYVAGKDNNDRTVQVFDPVEDTFEDLVATEGTLPTTCRFINRFRHRLVLCGDDTNPNNIFMSRIGDVTDWDYEAADSGAAINFLTSEAGVVGEPITAVIEHTDDCIIFGCHNSIWVMRGDPGHGGVVEKLASEIGILTHQSYCYSPDGYLWVMTSEGLYSMNATCGGPFTSVSREKLPQELRGIDRTKYDVSMVYDQGLRGILIFVSGLGGGVGGGGGPVTRSADFFPTGPGGESLEGGTLPTSHFFVDIRTTMGGDVSHRSSASFWPISFPFALDPTACANLKGGTGPFGYGLMGTRTGAIRRFNTTLEQDDNEDFVSYVIYGPVMLGDSFNEGALTEITTTLAYDSEDVQWELYVSDNAEDALHLDKPSYTGVWSAGVNRTYYPRLRGRAAYIAVRGEFVRWCVEDIVIVREKLGRRRARTKSTRDLTGSSGPTPVV